MTITISPLVAWPIKMQDLHKSTSWVILICDILYSVHAWLIFCLQKISVCSDDISMIMTSFIDDLSQLNVKQGTVWVLHCIM